jgi:hypothetical protein
MRLAIRGNRVYVVKQFLLLEVIVVACTALTSPMCAGHFRQLAMKKVKFNVYISPELAAEVRAIAFEHRLTLGEFFEAAAKLELDRLRTAEAKPREPKLRTGRPLRPVATGG